jgi:hypothetical protein
MGATSFFMGGDLSNKQYNNQISPRNNNQKVEGLSGHAQHTSSTINESLLPISSTSIGNTGHYTFKGKRSGINQSSSLQANHSSNGSSFTVMGPNSMF